MNPKSGAQLAATQVPGTQGDQIGADGKSGGWDIANIEADPELAEMLMQFADLAIQTPAYSEESLLREALTVIAPWGRSGDDGAWQPREARIRQMIDLGACESAAIELLPLGASFKGGGRSKSTAEANVMLADGTSSGPTPGQTLAIAIISALFRTLAIRGRTDAE